jgi:hypothetical protein
VTNGNSPLLNKGGNSMEPYYELDLTTRNQIIGLINQCNISNLGNVSFDYYATPKSDNMSFHMSQNNDGWELVVIARRSGTRDMYKIVDGLKLSHDYSEKD